MFYKHIIMIIFVSVYLIQTAMASHPTALQIMEKVDARNDGASLTCDMEMQLIDHRDNIRTRRIRLYSKDYGKDVYAIQFFMSPSDVKNTAFLSYDYDGSKDDDQWLYLPALRKTKRIAVDDKTSSYMGSDFSYADMTKIELENYHFKLLEERTVRGKKVWLIESTPKTDDIVKKFGYTKSILFIRQDNYMILRGILWLRNSNKMKFMDVTSMKKIDNIWTVIQVTMTTKKGKKTNHKTVLNYSNIKYNQAFEDQMFTVRRMEKGL